MSYWEPSDRWRDSYDSWKLASPDDYSDEEAQADEEEYIYLDALEHPTPIDLDDMDEAFGV